MKIHTSDKVMAYLALLSGLTISAVAIYYSVAGLVAIFAAAVVPIIVMGVALEVSKLVATVWLKLNWKRAPVFIKGYLLIAITILMVITSMGIFGFLSKAHSDQALVSGDVVAKIAIIDEKIKIERENIANAQSVIKQMDAAVNGVISTGDQEVKLKDGSTKVNSAAERSLQIRRSQAKDRAKLTAEIEQAQARIVKMQEEAAPIRAEVRKVEAEVGPIKYIAALIYGDNPDSNLLERAVRWVIIIIVAVFDPLAVILLLSSQYSFQWFREEQEADAMEEHFEEAADALNDVFAEELAVADPISASAGVTSEDVLDIPVLENEETWAQRAIDENTKFDEVKPLEQWNEMIAEAEAALVQEEEKEENDILDAASDSEKASMKAWKHDNPTSSLKLQRRLFERGAITKLPWEDYQPIIKDEAVEEARKWAEENPEAVESVSAKEWAEEKILTAGLDERPGDYVTPTVTYMENVDGHQVTKSIDGYQQNAEQGESTLWKKIKDAKQ